MQLRSNCDHNIHLGYVLNAEQNRNNGNHPEKITAAIASTSGAVLGKNIWGAWPLIICETTTDK